MVSVRKASSDMSQWESSLPSLSNGQLTITSVEVTDVIPLIDEYQFGGQRILEAQFEYKTTNPFDKSVKRVYTGELTFRSGSNIILVSTESDTPSSGEVIQRLGQTLPEGVEIYPGLFPTRQSIWNFIEEADEILEVEVFYNNELQPYDDIEKLDPTDVIGEYMVERADLLFKRDGHDILVTYADDSLNIQEQEKQDKKEIEYITQIFEREVITN